MADQIGCDLWQKKMSDNVTGHTGVVYAKNEIRLS